MEKEGEAKLKGISGWLILFLAMTALSEYLGYTTLKEAWTMYMGAGFNGAIMSLFSAISLILGVVSFFLILYKKRIAIQISILYLWSDVVIAVILFFIASTNIDYNYSNLVPTTVQSIVRAIIWTLYFNQSKRVKNTLVE